jgi:hypothetical protein
MNVTSPHLTLEELAAHGSTGLSAAAGRHLAECAACRVRSRAVAADGVRFLVTRCQLPPNLIDHVLADIDARASAGVADRVTRRRRRLALRPVAAVTAALAAGAVALAVVGVPGARHDGTGRPVVDTAYVIKRVDSALSAAGSGEIAQVTFPGGTPVTGGTTTEEEWSYGGQWRRVTYSPAGQPTYDEGSSTASVYTQVSYLTRTWSRGPVPRNPAALLPGAQDCGSTGPASVARALRAAIFCVNLAQAGRQRVDGVEVIELTGRDSRISETIWVSPGTYLPLRVVTRPVSGSSGPSQEADITWLEPTGQNRAKLTVPIPAGFRQVPLSQLPGPRSREHLGVLPPRAG